MSEHLSKNKVRRILHITAVRELGSGQRQQLIYEDNASKHLLDVKWDTIAYHSDISVNSFERKTPKIFDFLIIRNFYFWLQVFKASKHYDIILLRHMSFDPFAFIFSPFIKNRISVHHSKEIEELPLVRKGWKGKVAAWLEKYTGKVVLKNGLAIVGVTREIALYEKARIIENKALYIYPNGIDFSLYNVIGDRREKNEYHILFMCSYFSEWHGLDLLLGELEKTTINRQFYIHLIGNLTKEQLHLVESNPYNSSIIVYGELDRVSYLKIAEKCDVGIASIALYRKNLSEASTLKVREMLAMGLPVFSGHKDVAFDDNFPFYEYSEQFTLKEVLEFCQLHKSSSRQAIRDMSRKYIDKINILANFIYQLKSV